MVDINRNMITVLEVRAAQAISEAKRYEKVIRDANRASTQAAVNANTFGKTLNTNAKSVNNFRRIAGQMGFQMADLAIVMDQGQAGARAFGIQMGQLLGAMGPFGAVAGAAVTGLGIFIAMLSDGTDELEQYREMLDDIRKSTKELNDETERLQLNISPEVQNARRAVNEFEAALDDAIAAMEEAQTTEIESLNIYDERVDLAREELRVAQQVLQERISAENASKRQKERLEEQSVALSNQLLIAQALADIDNARLITHQELLTTLQNQGREMLNNIRNNPDFGDPRGEGPGVGDPNYIPPEFGLPPVNLPPNPSSGRGGGGAAAGVDELTQSIKRLLPQVQDAIDSYQSWTDLMKGDFKEGLVDVTESGVGSFVDMIAEADLAFKEFAKNFLKEIAKMILQQSILNILTMAFPGMGFSGTAPPVGLVPHAKGGVIGSPTVFAMGGSNKLGIAGEAGPEAIMPLSRDSSGRLGVAAAAPQVEVHNYAGAEVEVTMTPDEIIQVAVRKSVDASRNEFMRQINTGSGGYSQALEQGYKTRRRVY